MAVKSKQYAQLARRLWAKADVKGLVRLSNSAGARRLPEVHFYGGLARHALNQKPQAIACWKKAVELRSDYADALRALAYEFAAQRDLPTASRHFLTLLQNEQATADDLTTLAEIFLDQDNLVAAHILLDRALQLEPDNSLALLDMASLAARLRDRERCLRYLTKAAGTKEIDLSDLAEDRTFEFLWRDKRFSKLITANGS